MSNSIGYSSGRGYYQPNRRHEMVHFDALPPKIRRFIANAPVPLSATVCRHMQTEERVTERTILRRLRKATAQPQ